MANNERVSQLVELFASDFQSNDVFLVTDTSQKESKKVELGQLLLFIESSGSFQAYSAINAETASYVSANNIVGIIPFATNTSQSISSSYSSFANTSSYSCTSSLASTASFVLGASSIIIVPTSSFLQYLGTPNGTSSYSLQSALASNAITSSNLFYNGITPNGTASYALSSSTTISSSFAATSSFAISSSFATTSSYSSTSTSSSYAQTASVLSRGNLGPTFITPVTIYSLSSGTAGWTSFNCNSHVPTGTKVVILDVSMIASSTIVTPNFEGSVYISDSAGGTPYYVLLLYTLPISTKTAAGGQGTFPINILGSLYYNISVPDGGVTTLRLIGYY